ncbi:MAG: nucleotidyltransferase family protein [Rubrivivax sp.]|nr:nucleotidyltransferase family protein [Rubrivivax sp.]
MTFEAPRDVTAALQDPLRLAGLTPGNWDLVVRQARAAGILARLDDVIAREGVPVSVPAGPALHLESFRLVADAQRKEVLREVRQVHAALQPIGTNIVLLKGAAYVVAELPAARGRLFADLDIMVPKEQLPDVEAQLRLHGWIGSHYDAYDQRYYREWMHEIPPLEHIRRGTVLDVHHNILPPTSCLKPDPAKLFAAAVPAASAPGLKILAPADMVLHSMSHLFHNDDLSHALRDLSDLDLLLRHFGKQVAFWPELVERARELDLARPLHYGLRYSKRVLATPVPEDALHAASRAAPVPGLAGFMDAMWLRALRPPHPTTADWLTPFAMFFLYVRAHWLRMPPHLLLPHLIRKSWKRRTESWFERGKEGKKGAYDGAPIMRPDR